jgi:hypothetical protein
VSGAQRHTHAQYVIAGLCPEGCGRTLKPSAYDEISRCAECDWMGPSRVSAENTVGALCRLCGQSRTHINHADYPIPWSDDPSVTPHDFRAQEATKDE